MHFRSICAGALTPGRRREKSCSTGDDAHRRELRLGLGIEALEAAIAEEMPVRGAAEQCHAQLLGQAVAQAVGDKKGIVRYGHAYVPLDEALSRVVVDFSGRPGLEFHVPFTRSSVGGFDVDLFMEFFQGFTNHALVTLHIDNLRGDNGHHQAETVFKAFGRALRMALALDPRMAGVTPSTKGVL